MNNFFNPELVFFLKFLFLWVLTATPVLLAGFYIEKKLKTRKQIALAKQRGKTFY